MVNREHDEGEPTLAVLIHAPVDVRVDEVDKPAIVEPTDAVISVAAACVCGSDLWPYRGLEDVNGPTPMGHECIGAVFDLALPIGEADEGLQGDGPAPRHQGTTHPLIELIGHPKDAPASHEDPSHHEHGEGHGPGEHTKYELAELFSVG